MVTEPLKCLRCNGTMQEGFLFDGGLYAPGVSHWYPGPPQRRSFGRGIEVLDTRLKRVAACRCEKCGTLELVAR